MEINLTKIKKEFKKTRKSFRIFFLSFISVLILLLTAVFILFIYANFNNNSLINHFPADIRAIEYFLRTKDEKINDLFDKEMARHFNLSYEVLLPFDFKESAIIFLPEDDNIRPLLLLTSNKGDALRSWAKKNNLASEYLDEQTVLLTRYPRMLKYLKGNPFPQKKALKKFQQKNNFSVLFFLDLEKLKNEKNSIEAALTGEFKSGKEKIFIGVKKDSADYKIKIADTAAKEFINLKVTDKADIKKIKNFFIPSDEDKNIILSFKTSSMEDENYITAPFKKIYENSPFDLKDSELILIDNPDNLSGSEKINNLPHNALMLNGDKSNYYYVLTLKNNPLNQKLIDYIKNSSIAYLDKNMPEDRLKKLPDGTYMTETWLNPKRFSFAATDNGLNQIFYLNNAGINFEISYAQNQEYIMISNSKNALMDFSENHKTYHSGIKNDKDFFYLNNPRLGKSEIFRILNTFGKYTIGDIPNISH